MSRVTMAELAKQAGVSRTVVSAVINRRENTSVHVSERTRQRILDLVKHHGYVPNRSARALVQRRTRRIGVLVNSISPPFAHLLAALARQAHRMDLEVMPYLTHGDAKREEQYLSMVRDGRVDGVLVAAMCEDSEQRYRRYLTGSNPLHIVSISPPLQGINTICCDEGEGGRLVARHFAELGARRVAVAWRRTNWYHGYQGRAGAFAHEAEKLGLECIPLLREPWPAAVAEHPPLLVDAVRQMDPLPDAIFAGNDELALRIVWQLQRKGVRIPEDVRIVGYDDIATCTQCWPTLSSVNVNPSATAEKALELMERLIADQQHEVEHLLLPPRLEVRESSGVFAESPR